MLLRRRPLTLRLRLPNSLTALLAAGEREIDRRPLSCEGQSGVADRQDDRMRQ